MHRKLLLILLAASAGSLFAIVPHPPIDNAPPFERYDTAVFQGALNAAVSIGTASASTDSIVYLYPGNYSCIAGSR